MLSSLGAFPVLMLEIAADLVLLGVALTVVLRADRRAGLALSAGAALALTSLVSGAALEIGLYGGWMYAVVTSSGPPSNVTMALLGATWLAGWLPYGGRAMLALATTLAATLLARRIPAHERDDRRR